MVKPASAYVKNQQMSRRIQLQQSRRKQPRHTEFDPSNTQPQNTQLQSNMIPGDNLFDNPMVRTASAAMSEEDKEKYKRLGEEMYNNVDFVSGDINSNLPNPMAEATAYLCTQLQAGMHPSVLESNEKALLSEAYGPTWYTRWGYVIEDLTEIITLNPNLGIE